MLTYIEGQGFSTVDLPEDVSLKEESKVISNYPMPDIFVVEMLDCNYERQGMLKKHTHKLVVFDDLLDHIYCADLVVCGQALPDYGNKDISGAETKFLIGFDYFLCRPEFVPFHKKDRSHSESVKNVLVSLGGGRYDIGYLKVAYALKEFGDSINATFILGYAASDKLRGEIRKILPRAKIHQGVNDIERFLWETDLAVVSGGYTKLEATITGTPALVMSVQWHQIPLAEEFSRLTGIPHVGYMSFVSPDKLRKHIEQYHSLSKRKELSSKAHSIIDGRGFERVYSMMVQG
ncbi:MAG: hypothetical protein JRJ42_03600 [Deltaproteobacteria bacterium]|nr:hypothetical protein [Deltaproteobacteria bacterium]